MCGNYIKYVTEKTEKRNDTNNFLHLRVPELATVFMWPKLASVFLRGPCHGEPLRPHHLRKELRDGHQPVPGNALGGSNHPEFPFRRQSKKPTALALQLLEVVIGHAVVGDLKSSPSLTGLSDQSDRIRVEKVDNGYRMIIARERRVGRGARCPSVGIGQCRHRVEV